jgi:hypothetical protein
VDNKAASNKRTSRVKLLRKIIDLILSDNFDNKPVLSDSPKANRSQTMTYSTPLDRSSYNYGYTTTDDIASTKHEVSKYW